MEAFLPTLAPHYIALTLIIAVISGFVKGVVGFAMPLVMISGLSTFLAPELALAGLILPTLVTNIFQSLRQGRQAAGQSIKRFRFFLLAGAVTLFAAAQMVRMTPDAVLMSTIGVVVTVFAVLQLSGYRFPEVRQSRRLDVGVGAVAGGLAGLSGVWGPPTVAYLTALNTQKYDQMRIQGVIYGLGAVGLVVAHMVSGVLRAETWLFSAVLIPPAFLGMWIGGKVMDRIDQAAFRRATLYVLLIAGLNLLRRALF